MNAPRTLDSRCGNIGIICGILLAATIAASPAWANCYQWPVRSVYDGDTVRITMPGLPVELAKVADRLSTLDKSQPQMEELGYAAGSSIAATSISTAIRAMKGGE